MAIFPPKLRKGDHIRVIAPARSMYLLSQETIDAAIGRLEEIGLTVSFGVHVMEKDIFMTSSVESRVADLHDAFADASVHGILSVVGGHSSNQMLGSIDYELLRSHPKVLCGFSDITSLSNAIYAKTGVVGYSGPHFSSWGIRHGFEYSIDFFRKCCMEEGAFEFSPAEHWSDDEWYIDQEKRTFYENAGYWVLQEGEGAGRIIGGHLPCLSCLQGTPYWPALTEDTLLFLEQDEEFYPQIFERQLQSLIQMDEFRHVRGIAIGRFQKKPPCTREMVEKMIYSKRELEGMPILGNIDFGHTMPFATFPIGGTAQIYANASASGIRILQH